MNRFKIDAALILMSAAAAAAPSNEDMARCAVIPTPDSRLACYDALVHRPADKLSAAAKGIPPPAPAPVRATVPASAPVAAAPTAPAAQAPVSAAAMAAADPKNFGLTPAQQHLSGVAPNSIAAHISVVSSDQVGHTLVVLDSGETWTVMDNDGRLNSGDAVTIKKAALGSFLLLTSSNHSYWVRRKK
ncbi:MAG: hypothetical protein ABI356_01405 [Steroidobacteraceae bacterium]